MSVSERIARLVWTGYCAIEGCSSGVYGLNIWLENHDCPERKSWTESGNSGKLQCSCEPPFRLFPFPSKREKDKSMREKWIQLVTQEKPGKKVWTPGEKSRVCSRHFVDGYPTAEHPHPTLHMRSEEDGDYNPSPSSKRKKAAPATSSPASNASVSDYGKKRRLNEDDDNDDDADHAEKKAKMSDDDSVGYNPEDIEVPSYSDIICTTHKMNNVDVEIPDDDIIGMTYNKFSKLARRDIQESNPKASGIQITALLGAKWREFKELYGIGSRSETPDFERVRHTAQVDYAQSSDSEVKGSSPPSPESSIMEDSVADSHADSMVDSVDDDIVDDESSVDLKLKMVRRGGKLFKAGDRKSGRQRHKTERTGIVNLDEINLDEVGVIGEDSDDQSQESKKKPSKKRTGPRIKNTLDKKEKKREKERNAIARAAGKKPPKKVGKRPDDVRAPTPEHNSVCDVCGEGGDILLCDTCTCSWHLTCLDPPLDEVPEGTWSCPKCEAEMTGQLEEEEDDENFHGDYCKTCKDGGELLCCDFCPGTYHMKCVKPQLIAVPEGEWKCPMCKVEPLPGKVERILFWKFLTHYPTSDEVAGGAKNESYKVRKFFVKFHNMSYWKCHWIDELQLEKYHVSLYRFFCRKNDMNDAPMTEEGTLEEGEDTNMDDKEHKRNLDARFYQYGVKEEWLQIHRILWHRETKKAGRLQYLVKWRELGYDQATWEYPDDSDNKDVLEFPQGIEKYNQLREEFKKRSQQRQKDSKRPEKQKKREGWEHDIQPNGYKEEPSFIVESGGKLHDYQMKGLNWLRYSWGQRENTILADEMGLGKTIQTITFLQSLYREGRSDGPFLISAPLSTLVNWEREFEYWAPEMYVVSYGGPRENRSVIRNYEFTFDEDSVKQGKKAYKIKKDTLVKFHVLLTSYELVAIDANTLQSIDWKVLVIDEAHRLKNNQSRFFRTMSTYSIDYTLLLTGTPLQNNLEELFHLLNFLCPGKFQNRELFLSEFEDIGKEDQIKKLHEMLGPHMLRRLKADVLKSMPTKSEFIVRVELSAMQKKYYKYILTKNFEALNARGSHQVSLLNIVMELKKCCNHPYLFSTAAAEAPRYATGAYEVKALTEASGKLMLLYKMLHHLKREGHRVLVFSQMTRVLDLLEDFMEGHGWKYERLDGTITGSVRQAAIDRFNTPGTDIFSFLLSTRAGGLGINLATADTVIIYDSDWNPHNDIQAFSRAHRIGQMNKVMIYRFVTRNTVEERITQVAKRKMMLTHLVVRPGLGSKAAQTMSKRELDDILKFGTDEIFKDEDEEAGRIHYDDAAIAGLLDRSKEGILEKESGMDDYLSSFKVASYTVKSKDEPDVEVLKQEADKIDSDYWEKLLRHHYDQEQEYIASTLGKGKRVRKQVNYVDTADSAKSLLRAYDDSSDFDASELVDDSDDDTEDDASNLSSRKRFRERDVLPPLLAKVGGHIEVFGFNPRQRRAFLTAVMRYGLPPKDFQTAKDKWCIHNLRGKTEKAFQAYTSMFLRHLCEPGMDNKSDTYSDGVPRESVNRLQVLSRIGMMSLIKRKVEEYASINTFLSSVMVGHITNQDRSMSHLYDDLRLATAANPSDEKTLDKAREVSPAEEKVKKEGPPKDHEKPESRNGEPNDERDLGRSNPEDDDEQGKLGGLDEKPKQRLDRRAETLAKRDEDAEKRTEQADGPVEKPEKRALKADLDDPAPAAQLAEPRPGMGTSEGRPGDGIKQQDAEDDAIDVMMDDDAHQNDNALEASSKQPPSSTHDVKLSTASSPAETSAANAPAGEATDSSAAGGTSPPSSVVADGRLPKFMFNIADGGFTELHVLWEAEEKRKYDNIWWRYHDYWLLCGVVVHGYGRWQDVQNDPRFDTVNRPFARMSLDYKNKFIARRFKLLEQALIVEEQLKRATLMGVQQDNNHPAMALQSRFAELECLAESHQHLSKESLAGNKPANAVLHKVLNQLEALLSDMKNDVVRLPAGLAKMPPVTHRLGMSERVVLTRLATGGVIPTGPPPPAQIAHQAVPSPLPSQQTALTSPPASGAAYGSPSHQPSSHGVHAQAANSAQAPPQQLRPVVAPPYTKYSPTPPLAPGGHHPLTTGSALTRHSSHPLSPFSSGAGAAPHPPPL